VNSHDAQKDRTGDAALKHCPPCAHEVRQGAAGQAMHLWNTAHRVLTKYDKARQDRRCTCGTVPTVCSRSTTRRGRTTDAVVEHCPPCAREVRQGAAGQAMHLWNTAHRVLTKYDKARQDNRCSCGTLPTMCSRSTTRRGRAGDAPVEQCPPCAHEVQGKAGQAAQLWNTATVRYSWPAQTYTP
jgi:hypothetical protein